jgi:hypothetical protein
MDRDTYNDGKAVQRRRFCMNTPLTALAPQPSRGVDFKQRDIE